MEINLINTAITQKRVNKEVQIDWALIEKYLVDFNLNDKEEELQNQQPQDPTTSGRDKQLSQAKTV